MNRFSAGLKSSSPLLKQGAPTRFGLDDIGALVLTQGLKPNSFVFFTARLKWCPDTKQED